MTHNTHRTELKSAQMVLCGIMYALIAFAPASIAAASVVTLSSTDVINEHSLDSSGHWSNAAPPSTGNDYVVANGYMVRTPSAFAGAITFAGNSMILGNGSTSGSLYIKGSNSVSTTVNIANLIMNNGSVTNAMDNSATTLSGSINVQSGGAVFDAGALNRSLTIASNITGSGNVSISNGNNNRRVIFSGVNSYTGSTRINASSSLSLSQTGSLLLDIHDGGNSGISGQSATTSLLDLDGTLRLNTSAVTNSGSWMIIDPANLAVTYNTHFSIAIAGITDITFTNGGGIWTLTDSAGQWTFSQSTGILNLLAVPEPSALCILSSGCIMIGLRLRKR